MQKQLFQLIEQLNTQARTDALSYITSIQDSQPDAVEFRQQSYLYKTGVSIDSEVDSVAVLQKIESLLSSNDSIDINSGLKADDWYKPIIAAVRTGNLQLVKLLIEHGATISQKAIEDSITAPHIFNYFLDKSQNDHVLKKIFHKLPLYFEAMEFEHKKNPVLLKLTKESEHLLQGQVNQTLDKENAAEEDSYSKNIPDSLLLNIFGLLSDRERNPVSLVCLRWHRLTNDQRLWNPLVKPEFRGENAKLNFFDTAGARANQAYLFQLIARLDANECKRLTEQYFSGPTDQQHQFYAHQFYSNTGLPISAHIDERQTLKELKYVIKFSRLVDINLGKNNPNDFFTPLIAAIRTNNPAVVQLLVSCDAQITNDAIRNSLTNSDVFNYLIDACPNTYQSVDRFRNIAEDFEMMKHEIQDKPDDLALLLECESLFHMRHETSKGSNLN